MKKKIKRIAVLTSGGDAQGMNSAVRAVTRRALDAGVEVYASMGGYYGLVHDVVKKLKATDVANIEPLGGTIIWTDRCDEFRYEEGMQKAIATCRKYKIDAVIAIGGDGTFRGATDLSVRGIPTVGVPGTIDNDITASDYTIGFDTAMNRATEAFDSLRDTCQSHNRINVLECMGRGCGDIALRSGLAAGAVGIAIPEVPFDEDALVARIKEAEAAGKRSLLISVSEGVAEKNGKPFGEYLTDKLNALCKAGEIKHDARFCRIAHVFRGGAPTLRDRDTATRMGAFAVDMLLRGESDRVVLERNGKLVSMEIKYALITDRMYKGKLKEGDLDGFTGEQIAGMKEICEERAKEAAELVALADALCI